MNQKIIKQTMALKSIGLNTNEIAKRFNMTGMELKREIKKHIREENRKRIEEWRKQNTHLNKN